MLKPSCDEEEHPPSPLLVRTQRSMVTRINSSAQGLSPPPRPQIRQIRSFRKLRPASPPSPPASPLSESSASSTASSPTRQRKQRRPSPPTPHKSGFFDSRDVDRERDSVSPKPARAERQVSPSDTARETPSKSAAERGDIGVSPSPRRPPPKLRRRISPTPG